MQHPYLNDNDKIKTISSTPMLRKDASFGVALRLKYTDESSFRHIEELLIVHIIITGTKLNFILLVQQNETHPLNATN